MDNLLVYKILHALGHANAKEEETRRIKQLAAGALCDKIGLQTLRFNILTLNPPLE